MGFGTFWKFIKDIFSGVENEAKHTAETVAATVKDIGDPVTDTLGINLP